MKQIILDTNFILHSINYRIDIKEELQRICNFQFETFVLDNTIKELKILKKPLAIQIANSFQIIETNEDKDVDSQLIEYSKDGYIIATQDIELKKQLNKPIIVIRQRKYFEIQE